MILCISVCALWACTDTHDIPHKEAEKEILVLFAPNALGDNGYNDQIYRGVVQYINEEKFSDIDIDYYNPTSIEEGKDIIKEWNNPNSEYKKRLLVLPGLEYKEVIDELFGENAIDTTSRQILLFESSPIGLPGVSTFKMSMYGASYIAGAIAGKMMFVPLIALANGLDSNLIVASDGFKDGYADFCSEDSPYPDVTYLSEADGGYAMADAAYMQMYDWAKLYNFVFPVMGGSNMGVFRYIRQYPQGLYTVGMDVDQSSLCNQIIGSIIKDMDVIVKDYLDKWSSDEVLPKHADYGLGSGYVRFQVSDNYADAFTGMLEELCSLAIIKENGYEQK